MFENKVVLWKVLELKKKLYCMIKEYPDVFTNDYVATQPWDKFNIELLPGAKPLRQRVRPFRATTEHNSMDTVRKLDSWSSNWTL